MVRRFARASAVTAGASFCLLAWTTAEHTPVVGPPREAAVDAYILGPLALVTGSSATYRVAVHWAASPRDSGPLAGASVVLALAEKGKPAVGERVLVRGRTDDHGNLEARFVVPRLGTGKRTLVVRVNSSVGEALREREVTLVSGGGVLLTTDKSLYQPAQMMHIRALSLRSIDLVPAADRPVHIRVSDPKNNVVFAHDGRSSRFGIVSADFQLADEINLGQYAIESWVDGAEANDRSVKRVEVTRYVPPKFKVSVEAERVFYRPGETLRGTVRCRYFFGKPVAKAAVTLRISYRMGRGVAIFLHLAGPATVTDAEGRHTFEVQLSEHATDGDGLGEVRVKAEVVDTAKHREKGDLALPFTATPLRLSVVPENRRLVRRVKNRVHVVAGYPDGSPAKHVAVSLFGWGFKLTQRTDELGVATFELVPRPTPGLVPRPARRSARPGDDRSPPDDMQLLATARDALGQRGSARVSAPIAPSLAVLVRPVGSLVAPGQPVELEVFAAPSPQPTATREQVFVDVVKAGQTIATYAQPLQRGHAHVEFQPDAALFGLLELRAYRLRDGGERVSTSRMVYVDHPGELKITASGDQKSYRPGSRARLTFQVADSRTGDGVEAALGLIGVDEAVVAMSGMDPSAPKVFFTLSNQAKGVPATGVRPGGRELADWVSADAQLARRDRAADVLLAAVEPAESPVWETNPWAERRDAWAAQAPRLISAALSFMRDHSVGQRTAAGWRFDPELVPRMAAAKVIEASQVRDPWRRTVRPWHLHETNPRFEFNHHAATLAQDKLEHIYRALAEVWDKVALKREAMRTLPRRKWPLVLPANILETLVARGKLKPADIVDPWGNPYRVGFTPGLFVNSYESGLVSRYLIHSAGPDGVSASSDDFGPDGPRALLKLLSANGAFDRADELAIGKLVRNFIGEVYGAGSLGLRGTGAGGGGVGYGSGMGRIGSIGGSLPARVRSLFPETLLWHPELVTDRRGRATLDVDLADSITTWRVQATGSSTNGLLGSSELALRVFQDFFVDVDLPASLTQKDRISVPVTVYNYLKTPQKVTLRLARAPWFDPAGPIEQTVELGPSEVTVRYFPIVARQIGRYDLTVQASARGTDGKGLADAVRRSTRVEPDGVEHARAHSGSLVDHAVHELAIPPQAISGTARVQLAMYSGPTGETLDGLDGMLRKPYGCFEQTSSTSYPNVLILDYLKRTHKATPAIERKARELINEGYQRLVSFEVVGGGFSWFGTAPANRVLTAYGLLEFFDMARVHPVDSNLILRTQRWLAKQQRPDGSWNADSSSISDGATNAFQQDRLRVTAYLAHALRHTGYTRIEVARALAYVRNHADQARDPYTLALIANLLATERDGLANAVRARLWAARHASPKGVFFESQRATLTHGAGESGSIETTALAALAFLSHGSMPRGGERIIDALVASKDAFGSWHSTQATILSLRALLLDHERNSRQTSGEVQVLVDNRPVERVRITVGEDRSRQLDLSPWVSAGRHRVALRFAGHGSLRYNLVGHYWLPRNPRVDAVASPAIASLSIRTEYDRLKVQRDGQLELAVEVKNRGKQQIDMPLVSLALPPGFSVDESVFADLVKAGKVDKVQRVSGQAVLYLTRLGAGQSVDFTVTLRGRYPLEVQARPSVVYEYYRPENRAQSAATVLQVL